MLKTTSRSTNRRNQLLFGGLCIVVFLSFFYNLNGAPLFDRDEGAFSEATREMFERGDFISTYLNGEPRYDKPILIYWLQALSVLVFGVGEFAFRLPSAVAAACWVFAVYGFVRERENRETSWAAAMITATGLWVSLIGRAAIADALLNLLIALSMFDLFRYFQQDKPGLQYRVFLWTGLGVLTKGPVALVIPFGVSLLFFLMQKQWRRWLRSVFNPVGIAILLAVTLPWYVAQYLKEGQAFIDGFFLKHNVGRFLAPMEGHSGGFYYYILAVLVMVLPYTALLIRILKRLRHASARPLDVFLWVWFFFVLIFFSLSGTKLPHYVLHGCTPVFILMAKYREDLRLRLLALLPALLFLVVVVLLPEIAEQVRLHTDDTYTRALLEEADAVLGLGYRIWAVLAAAGGFALLFLKRLRAWQALVIAGVLNIFILGHQVLPAALKVMQLPVKEAGLLAKAEGYDVIMWDIRMPSFSVYRQEVTPRGEPQPGQVVFTRVDRLHKLERAYQIVYEKGGIVLALVE
jgi:4-amino-4-deoxy-L-arabinose transferase-like glycosyltransferase